ncbi:hypothetical protein BCR44DRAFT_62182 [Catenaria anguillulae PL171]|uniref:Uncharacterized protein n=1 Tax=Catenaria anguillulae PL171 TaxID=765915 RepID=A0A1Y2HBQ8_9FUNG|nr:hypothetical protein BCR44DRAFT_62182 [Catenaria anguillulae PL171]
MRVVFVHINQVEISAGNPRLFFVRVTLQSPPTANAAKSSTALQLTLRTDISTEPTLTPTFRLPKLHFKLPALPTTGSDKKKPQHQPSNDQLLTVLLDVYEISPDAGPRLVGSAKSNVAALVDSAPPLALMAPLSPDGAQQSQVGVIRATSRAFSGTTPGNGAASGANPSELDEMHGMNVGSEEGEYGPANAPQPTGGSRIDSSEAYAEPGQCGKRLALTIVSLRNAHSFKNSALSFAIMTGTAIKTRSAPVIVTGSGEVMHLGLSLNCVIDTINLPTASTLTTLVLFERDKPRAKFHLSLPATLSPLWPSHAQLATVLKCSSTSSSGSSIEGLELHVLMSTLDLTISSPAALLVRLADAAKSHSSIVTTLNVKSTTAPLPVSRAGRCLLHVQALPASSTGSVDAFLNDMMMCNPSPSETSAASPTSLVAPRPLAKFPLVTFDGSGTPTCTWPPPPPSVKSHAKYLISEPGRSAITDNVPVSFQRRTVLVSSADHRSAINLAFQLFAVVSPGHDYVLVAYGTLELDHAGTSAGLQSHVQHPHRVRLFPTAAYRTVFATAECGRVYLDVGVHIHHSHLPGQVQAAANGSSVGDETMVDLPVLEPVRCSDVFFPHRSRGLCYWSDSNCLTAVTTRPAG